LVGALTAGRGDDACRVAARRLREKGLVPVPQSRAGSAARDGAWNEAGSGCIDGRRLAAALLIPIADADVRTLRNLVLRETRTPDSTTLEA
jgi:CRISPR-associated protein Csx17